MISASRASTSLRRSRSGSASAASCRKTRGSGCGRRGRAPGGPSPSAAPGRSRGRRGPRSGPGAARPSGARAARPTPGGGRPAGGRARGLTAPTPRTGAGGASMRRDSAARRWPGPPRGRGEGVDDVVPAVALVGDELLERSDGDGLRIRARSDRYSSDPAQPGRWRKWARSLRKRPSSTPGLTPSSNRRMNFTMAWSPKATEVLDCSAARGTGAYRR